MPLTSRNDLFSASWVPDLPPPKRLDDSGPSNNIFDRSPPTAASPRASSSVVPSPLNLSRSSSLRVAPSAHSEPLSPIHQSPSLPPSNPTWQPPLPPSSDDIEMRFSPSPEYLLGEGRYARVYLASYKTGGKGKSKVVDEVTEVGDGLVGGSWRLCAAKRMSPDRESQTLGLREAFFLNRLSSSVNIVKLIAVKEDREFRRAHGRSTSDVLSRQRSSTLISHPSIPLLRGDTPAVSRLVLLLEHAPFGTVDRLLRISPHLVDRDMWEKWAEQSTAAVEWVHAKGVIHADVKPGNLLLSNSLDLRLSDFGSSLLVHPSHPPTDGVGLGTLPFSPPELVDPTQSFAFPVDIFALGATLYQCITGKEPYRGVRTVEMMHHVRQGNLWVHEERERMGRIGSHTPSVSGSPYPSAWRDQVSEFGVRRGGSLRAPSESRPRLARMVSTESLRASQEDPSTPTGSKMWADWVRHPRHGAVYDLLTDGEPDAGPRQSPLRLASPRIEPVTSSRAEPYIENSAAMTFLDGERVSESIRSVLKAMLDPVSSERPSAEEVSRSWRTIFLGV